MEHAKRYWLMKSEPQSYSIDDLKRDKKTAWTGIRNYLARNYMRDGMQKGDLILFYHSSTGVPGVVGIGKVASEAYPDPTQFDTQNHYYESRATKEKPVWMLVDVGFVKKFKEIVPLSRMREESDLHSMLILRNRNRLSITPVTQKQFECIQELGAAS